MTGERGTQGPFRSLPDEARLWPARAKTSIDPAAKAKLLAALLGSIKQTRHPLDLGLPSFRRLEMLRQCEEAGANGPLPPLRQAAAAHRRALEPLVAHRIALGAKQSLRISADVDKLARCGRVRVTATATNGADEPFEYGEMGCSSSDSWRLSTSDLRNTNETVCYQNVLGLRTLAPGESRSVTYEYAVRPKARLGTLRFKMLWGQDPTVESNELAIVVKGDECAEAKPAGKAKR
jgi:hypothetical protein